MSAVSPYRGLVPYTEEDSEWFFGREDETELIGANLQSARLTLIYGTSGAGKSSVLRAGVIYRLSQDIRDNRVRYGHPEFAVAYFRSWCGNVTKNLVETIRAAAATALDARDPGTNKGSVVDECRLACTKLEGRLLLILDQFEEYFLYHPLGHEFENVLADLANSPDLPVNVLISMREDSLARLDRFKGKIPNLFSNYLRVKHLERESARSAIVEPVNRYRKLYPEEAIDVEPDLVERVLDSVANGKVQLADAGRGVARPQHDRVEAPYLQLVMTRLWDDATARKVRRITRDDLLRLGGAECVVRSHLERVLNQLKPDEQRVAAAIFHYLVTPTGSKIAYSISDLAELTSEASELVQFVINSLEKNECRVLRVAEGASGSEPSPRYEIYHDVLGRAVLEWRRQYLLQREREEEEVQAREGARLRKRRFVRKATYGALVALLVALLIYTVYSDRRARAASAQAALASEVAQRASELAQRASEERSKAQEAQRKTEEALTLAQQAGASLAESLRSCKSDAATVMGDLQQKLDRIKNQVDLARVAQANAEQYSLEAQKLSASAPAAAAPAAKK
ncbi:MAG TPA: hypothetical protein VKP30_34170 [Polyangiaceae bacterium]|nr:hypothetical protein [Polyangiaceae bacterium]